MPSLTDTAIRQALKRVEATGKQENLVDGEGRGKGRLVLILKPMPKRVTADWMAQQWRDGKRTKKKIGSYPSMSLAEARETFKRDFADVIQKGRSIKIATDARPGTVGDLFGGYFVSLKDAGKPSWKETEKSASGLSRAQIVYKSLKGLIRDGTLQPGERLREADLAGRLGVSRTPIREALNRLISEGLLALHPMRGLAVSELEKQQVLELYNLREFLEGASARFAAQHAAPAELQSLRDMVDESRRPAKNDTSAHALLNRRFHAAIGGASHNRYLQEALGRLSDLLGLVPGTAFEMEPRVKEIYQEHEAIVEAIEERDPAKAEEKAREHIRNSAKVRLVLLFGRD